MARTVSRARETFDLEVGHFAIDEQEPGRSGTAVRLDASTRPTVTIQ